MNIYFLQADNGLIKIGVTKNINQRLGVLMVENASQLKLLGVLQGDFVTEKKLHEQFASDRTHGEWFHPSQNILDFIKNNTERIEEVPQAKKLKMKLKKEEKRSSRAICLDEWEKQIIYGALLGNAFIVDPPKGLHCYLVIRQSKRQDPNSFLYKTTELKAFARQSAIYSDAHDYRWTSISHHDFDLVRDFCYKNKKKHVTMDWLDTLKDVSLMVWYLDRGFYKGGKLGINTVNLKGAQSVIHQYFNEIGMSCRPDGCKIVFEEKGKEEFLRIIAHRVPPSLYYRLTEARDIKMPKSLVYNLELESPTAAINTHHEEPIQNVSPH